MPTPSLAIADLALIVGPISVIYSDKFLAREITQSAEQRQASLVDEAAEALVRAFQSVDGAVERVAV